MGMEACRTAAAMTEAEPHHALPRNVAGFEALVWRPLRLRRGTGMSADAAAGCCLGQPRQALRETTSLSRLRRAGPCCQLASLSRPLRPALPQKQRPWMEPYLPLPASSWLPARQFPAINCRACFIPSQLCTVTAAPIPTSPIRSSAITLMSSTTGFLMDRSLHTNSTRSISRR